MNEHEQQAQEIAFLERVMRYQDGALNPDELAAFEQELKESPELRRRFAEAQLRSMSILERLRQDSYHMEVPQCHAVRSAFWQWRPLTAAAAGVAFGLFSASVVWGYVVPRAAKQEAILMTVVKGSFEGSPVPIQEGFPAVTGRWGGDACRVTAADQGIKPAHGEQMLRLIGASGLNARGRPTLSGDSFQIVDLRSKRELFADGRADLKISAWFNAIAETGTQEYTALVEVYALRGDPASHPASGDPRSWLSHEQIALAGRQVRFDHDPATWQSAATRVELPAEADYAVISIHVVPARPVQSGVPTAFPGHYVDFVRLALLPHARPSKPLPLPFDSES